MPTDSQYVIRAFTEWHLHRLIICYHEYHFAAAHCDPISVTYAEDDEVLEAFIEDKNVVIEEFRHLWGEFAYFCNRYKVYIDYELVYFKDDFKAFIEFFK